MSCSNLIRVVVITRNNRQTDSHFFSKYLKEGQRWHGNIVVVAVKSCCQSTSEPEQCVDQTLPLTGLQRTTSHTKNLSYLPKPVFKTVRERGESVCVCVCVRERERERGCVCVSRMLQTSVVYVPESHGTDPVCSTIHQYSSSCTRWIPSPAALPHTITHKIIPGEDWENKNIVCTGM